MRKKLFIQPVLGIIYIERVSEKEEKEEKGERF